MSDKNLYDELGVDKDASAAEIKKAFRKQAGQKHPDKPGGSKEEFQALQRSYQVLANPIARARYDDTGTILEDEKNEALAMLRQLFSDTIDVYLESNGTFNMVAAIRRVLAELEENANKERSKNKNKAKKYENLLGRITTQEETNLYELIVTDKMQSARQAEKFAESRIEVIQETYALLKLYNDPTIEMPANNGFSQPGTFRPFNFRDL